jgi:hypothetical protein
MPPRKTTGDQPATEKTTTDRGVRVQKIDAEGAPVGEPQQLSGVEASLEFTPDDSGIELPERDATLEFETSDPAAAATVKELLRIPIPTTVVNEWFPAYFRPPGDDQPWATCKVFLTPQGLYVYRTAPAEPETFTTGATPAWYAGVNFAETAKPVTGYAALNAGIPITTSAGRVNVQPFPGCGCSARRLKNWTPSWARNRISWTDAVALTDTTAGR